jgi:hypothetical protein
MTWMGTKDESTLTKHDDNLLKETAFSCSSKDSADKMPVVGIDQSSHYREGGFERDDAPHVLYCIGGDLQVGK